MEMHVSYLNKRLPLFVALFAVMSMGAPVVAAYGQQADPAPRRQQKPPAKPQQRPQAAAKAAPVKTEALPPSQIGVGTLAKQAFMVDPQTSTVLLFKDADKPMHPSSMAKMMTIHLLFDELAAGRVTLDTRYRVSDRARAMGGSRMFLDVGTEVRVEDLIRGMIVQSGNDACVVVAEGISGTEEAFAERMNKRAREIGMTGTVFKNASGWPVDGQITTARDIALLAWHTISTYPKYYRYYSETEMTYNNIHQDNRNRVLKTTPGADGLKTGHTEEGGYGQATSAIRDGRRLILVLNGMSSMAERASETARLMEWGFRESTNTTIFRAGDAVVEAPVWLGTADKVPLMVADPVIVTMPTGQAAQPRVVARFDGPLPAPIAKGTKVGTVVITLADGKVIEQPIETAADVPRLGPVSRVASLLKHYLFGWLS
jgi:serine-type D-Ala-D-Ala carboxypeptidase (penicillin-binding protein 5/6)